MGQAVLARGFLQDSCDNVLAEQVGESGRAIFAIEGKHEFMLP